jgi:hypothetical protein
MVEAAAFVRLWHVKENKNPYRNFGSFDVSGKRVLRIDDMGKQESRFGRNIVLFAAC